MLGNARRANPAPPWRIVWIALSLIALPGIVAVVIVLLSTGASTASGSGARPALLASSARASCSRTNRTPAPSARPGAGHTLVPRGATSVLLCRYGLLHRGGVVDRRLISSRAMTARLAGSLNALPGPRSAIVCPLFDTGQVLIVHFRYASGPGDPVTIDLSGCEDVSNGHVNRLGLGRSGIEMVLRLVPKSGFGGPRAG